MQPGVECCKEFGRGLSRSRSTFSTEHCDVQGEGGGQAGAEARGQEDFFCGGQKEDFSRGGVSMTEVGKKQDVLALTFMVHF